jgi:hypothetical protein
MNNRTDNPSKLSLEGARHLGHNAIIFGYAIVEHYKAIWGGNSPQSPRRAPAYQYIFNPRLYGPDDNLAVTANNDTIYGGCSLDLRAEPTVLQVPAMGDRFYSIQFIGGTTDDFAYVGTRSTGSKAGTYLIAGPDWHGQTPPGIDKVLRSPSRFAIAPVRVAVSGVEDLPYVADLGHIFILMPLSRYLNQAPPPSPAEVTWPNIFDPRTGDMEGFLNVLSFMMQWHEFSPADQAALDELARIGVTPGEFAGKAAYPAQIWLSLEAGFNDGRAEIARKADNLGPVINGWSFSPMIAGKFGANYLVRSATAWKYIYVQAAEEAMYPTADVDSDDEQLDGGRGRYTLEFPGNQLPRAKFFWSITLYDKKNGFLIHNPIERYSIGDRNTGLEYGADGNLTIYIQAESPSVDKISNWLPAPDEPFYLCMRFYGPQPEMLRGEYTIPAVVRQAG